MHPLQLQLDEFQQNLQRYCLGVGELLLWSLVFISRSLTPSLVLYLSLVELKLNHKAGSTHLLCLPNEKCELVPSFFEDEVAFGISDRIYDQFLAKVL